MTSSWPRTNCAWQTASRRGSYVSRQYSAALRTLSIGRRVPKRRRFRSAHISQRGVKSFDLLHIREIGFDERIDRAVWPLILTPEAKYTFVQFAVVNSAEGEKTVAEIHLAGR